MNSKIIALESYKDEMASTLKKITDDCLSVETNADTITNLMNWNSKTREYIKRINKNFEENGDTIKENCQDLKLYLENILNKYRAIEKITNETIEKFSLIDWE